MDDATTMDDSPAIEAPLSLQHPRTLTLRQRIRQLHGKLHRFYVGHFDKTFVARSLARRRGECARCGACCQLLVRCAFAAQCHDGAGCKIYLKRPINCRIFPLHERDLEERDMILPERKCGYSFEQ